MAKMNLNFKPREVDLEPQDPIPELRILPPPALGETVIVPLPTEPLDDAEIELKLKHAKARSQRPPRPPFDDSKVNFSTELVSWPEEVWAWLLNFAERSAGHHIGTLCWRGAPGGVLPRGFDAASIADEAIHGLLESFQSFPFPYDPEPGTSRIQQVAVELRRRVHRKIESLQHLKEQEVMVNIPDLDPFTTDDGETISVINNIQAADPTPDEVIMAEEDAVELEERKRQVIDFLGEDKLLQQVFAFQCQGITRRADIARELQLPALTIKNAQKRLERRWLEFRKKFRLPTQSG
jgi:hypothetical protein